MLFVGWLLAIVLYWSSAPLYGYGLIILMFLYSVLKSARLVVSSNLIYLVSASLFSYAFGLLKGGGHFSVGPFITAVHFVSLCVFLSFSDIRINIKLLHIFFRIFVLTALVVSLSYFFDSYRDFYYYTDANNSSRYKFIFSEPSFLGIFGCLLVFLILRYPSKYYSHDNLMVTCLVVLICLSVSGSGFSLLALVFAMNIFGKNKKISIHWGVLLSILFAIFYLAVFDDFLSVRLGNIMYGDGDRSAEIRFVATKNLVIDTARDNFLFGTGFGFHAQNILYDPSKYYYMIKVDYYGGDLLNTNIDNGWVYLIFNYGFLIGLVIMGVYARTAYFCFENRAIYLFVFFVLFFSGAYIHPIFIGMFFINFGNTVVENNIWAQKW